MTTTPNMLSILDDTYMDEEDEIATPGRYLVSVHLENFQSHKDSLLEFSPGFNLIIGTSNAGKTAVMRALHLLYHNGIRGDEFIRIGADEARVTATFSDGTLVQRIKGTKRNAYFVHLPDGREMAYDRIGSDVPVEVHQALGMPPVDEKGDPICIADSDGPNTHFLVYRTLTELPRAISHITGISDFEEAVQLLATRARTAQKQGKDSQARVDVHNQELKAYEGLDARCAKLERLGEKQALLEALVTQIDNGERIISDYAEIRREGKVTFNILQRSIKLSDLAPKLDSILKTRNQVRDGESLVNQFFDTQEQVESTKKKLAISNKLASNELSVKYNGLQKTKIQIVAMEQILTEYKSVVSEIERTSHLLSQSNDQLEIDSQRKIQTIESMRLAGQWCDACNRPLTI